MLIFRKPLPNVDHPEMPADVVIVGGGPAGMACALRLSQLIDDHNARHPETPLSKENIYLLEKAREAGQHCLSGALLDPRSMKELLPGFENEAPLDAQVHKEAVYFLTRKEHYQLPITPPPLQDHGNYIISINRFVKWLAGKVEDAGITIFTIGFGLDGSNSHPVCSQQIGTRVWPRHHIQIELAQRIAERLGVALTPVTLKTFPNGEVYARYEVPPVKGLKFDVKAAFAQGDTTATQNQLDLAIEGGGGFFRIQRANGDLGYTRAGNFRVDATGRLVTQTGEVVDPAITIPSDSTAVTIRALKARKEVVFSVHSYGPVIPVADRERIFDRFYRASTNPNRAAGTGIGLSVAKRAAFIHGGHVWVTSDELEGTTFFAAIPTVGLKR